jgi:hypothetical protein
MVLLFKILHPRVLEVAGLALIDQRRWNSCAVSTHTGEKRYELAVTILLNVVDTAGIILLSSHYPLNTICAAY